MAWAPDYVEVETLRGYRDLLATYADAYLAQAIAAASRAVDRHCNRQFGLTDQEERLYTPVWDRRRCRWIVPIDDLMTTSGVTFSTSAGEIDSYVLEPVNAAQKGKPWEQLVVSPDSSVIPTGAEHEVTGDAPWGWTAVPEAVETATLLQASRLASRRTSPLGVAGSPDMGSEVRLLARVDPDVAVTLKPFKRWSV